MGCEYEFVKQDQVVSVKWIMLRKNPVPGSLHKDWDKQLEMLSNVEYVSNASELLWGLAVYKRVRNTYLLNMLRVRTSSIGKYSNHVFHIGAKANGYSMECLSKDTNDFYEENIGLASTKRLEV